MGRSGDGGAYLHTLIQFSRVRHLLVHQLEGVTKLRQAHEKGSTTPMASTSAQGKARPSRCIPVQRAKARATNAKRPRSRWAAMPPPPPAPIGTCVADADCLFPPPCRLKARARRQPHGAEVASRTPVACRFDE